MNRRLTVALDIDGTLYPWARAVNEALMTRFKIADPGEHTSWSHLRDRVMRDQWNWIWSHEGAEPVFGRDDLIYECCSDAVNTLASEHDVHFVTHRNPFRLTEITGRWLGLHFCDYRGVHVLDNKTEKHTLADWDVLIDDKPETVERCLDADHGTLVLMPERPWNSDFATANSSGFARFLNWSEVPALITMRLGG